MCQKILYVIGVKIVLTIINNYRSNKMSRTFMISLCNKSILVLALEMLAKSVV